MGVVVALGGLRVRFFLCGACGEVKGEALRKVWVGAFVAGLVGRAPLVFLVGKDGRRNWYVVIFTKHNSFNADIGDVNRVWAQSRGFAGSGPRGARRV